MFNRLTDSLDFQGRALALRSDRQRLIASNIANADTPGYVAREMDFAQALREATGTASAVSAPAKLAITQVGHLAVATGAASDGGLLYATASQNSIDRNTVDMDRERASFADNAVKVEAALKFINSNVQTMLAAIKGQ